MCFCDIQYIEVPYIQRKKVITRLRKLQQWLQFIAFMRIHYCLGEGGGGGGGGRGQTSLHNGCSFQHF